MGIDNNRESSKEINTLSEKFSLAIKLIICATFWVTSTLLLTSIILSLKHKTDAKSAAINARLNQEESALKHRPSQMDRTTRYQIREKRSSSNDPGKFLKEFSKKDPKFKKSLAKIKSIFEKLSEKNPAGLKADIQCAVYHENKDLDPPKIWRFFQFCDLSIKKFAVFGRYANLFFQFHRSLDDIIAWTKNNSTTRKHASSIKEEWSTFQKDLRRMENMTKVYTDADETAIPNLVNGFNALMINTGNSGNMAAASVFKQMLSVLNTMKRDFCYRRKVNSCFTSSKMPKC